MANAVKYILVWKPIKVRFSAIANGYAALLWCARALCVEDVEAAAFSAIALPELVAG